MIELIILSKEEEQSEMFENLKEAYEKVKTEIKQLELKKAKIQEFVSVEMSINLLGFWSDYFLKESYYTSYVLIRRNKPQ